jgi:hypothetical protein
VRQCDFGFPGEKGFFEGAVGWVERPFIRWVSLASRALNNLGDIKKQRTERNPSSEMRKVYRKKRTSNTERMNIEHRTSNIEC